jgi:hypothetical protein
MAMTFFQDAGNLVAVDRALKAITASTAVAA